MELSINLIDNHQESYYIQIYEYIKEAIMEDNIHSNERLPSIRGLSKSLSVSRTTIENAYSQLLAEGYIYSLPQKGYFASRLENDSLDLKTKKMATPIEDKRETRYPYDFKNEYAEEGVFNFNIWKRHVNDVINYQQGKLLSYSHAQGEKALRNEILTYIFRTRGIATSPNHIVIGAGTQPLLNILSSILWDKGIRKLAMEDPGFNRAKSVFRHKHYDIVPIDVTKDGIDIDAIKRDDMRLCYITPSYQFPMGTIMLIDNRMKLIKWANDYDGYIIEDDFNSELRYEGKPIPALKGLDSFDKVIYIGSFSSVLVPSIRIGFMVLPDDLQRKFNSRAHDYSQSASKIDQLALASMMNSGDFERHMRRIRKRYALKHKLIVLEIESLFDGIALILGSKSGFNILLQFTSSINLEMVMKRCHEEGINVSSIDEYSMNKKDEPIILLNYRGITEENIKNGIRRLHEIVIECYK